MQKTHTQGVVVVGHDICESVRNISTGDNFLSFPSLICELNVQEIVSGRTHTSNKVRLAYTNKKKGENDAAYEQPFSGVERDSYAIVNLGTVLEDLV